MKYRYDFEPTGKVSLVGFGAWQLGNLDNWDGPDHDEAVQLVKQAYDLGVNFFDTAPNYGQGNSERILGEALKDVREHVFFNTKVGHGPDGAYEFTPEGIRRSVRRSLEKLQTTYLDSVILHNPERYILEGKSDLIDTLKALKSEGLIRKYGVSIDTLEELETVLDNLEVDTIEIMFNIIHQEPKARFDEVEKRHILLVVKVPLDSGWLTGKYDRSSTFEGIRSRWDKKTIETRAEIVDDIAQILGTRDLVAPALRFIMDFPAVGTVIPGTKNLAQLKSNVTSVNYQLDPIKKQHLEDLYRQSIVKKETPW